MEDPKLKSTGVVIKYRSDDGGHREADYGGCEMICSRCGCEGIHACIGHRPAPWTEEEKARFAEAMKAVAGDLRRLDQEQQVTPELMHMPLDAPILSVRQSEWRTLSPEAQAKLMKITGTIHPDELRRRAQAAEDARNCRLLDN